MTRKTVLILLVGLALLLRATDARAQTLCGPAYGPGPSDPCLSPCGAVLGQFGFAGAAVFPQGVGLHFAGGILYQYRVAVEADLSVPLNAAPVTRSFFGSALYARIRLMKEGLSEPWDHEGSVPSAAFLLALRVGPGIAIGASQPLGLAVGPSADFIFGGVLAIAFRPSILILPGHREGFSPLGLDVLPVFDLSIGGIGPGALGW